MNLLHKIYRVIAFFKVCLFLGAVVFYGTSIKEQLEAHALWKVAEENFQKDNYKRANKIYSLAQSQMTTNGRFQICYEKSLELDGQYERAYQQLKAAAPYWKDSYTYISMGNIHKARGNIHEAEKSYMDAAHLIPHKFYPHFQLFKLYYETGDYDKALAKAEYIRNKKVKVYNKALQDIYDEVEQVEQKIVDFKTKYNPD